LLIPIKGFANTPNELLAEQPAMLAAKIYDRLPGNGDHSAQGKAGGGQGKTELFHKGWQIKEAGLLRHQAHE
jgi:hypothetical protein